MDKQKALKLTDADVLVVIEALKNNECVIELAVRGARLWWVRHYKVGADGTAHSTINAWQQTCCTLRELAEYAVSQRLVPDSLVEGMRARESATRELTAAEVNTVVRELRCHGYRVGYFDNLKCLALVWPKRDGREERIQFEDEKTLAEFALSNHLVRPDCTVTPEPADLPKEDKPKVTAKEARLDLLKNLKARRTSLVALAFSSSPDIAAGFWEKVGEVDREIVIAMMSGIPE